MHENGKDYCYVIAEIGHNHQGELKTALQMIEVAANCGVDAVKLQKRDNRALYTKAYYDREYDNPNSYGKTYGEHREFLEFGESEYRELMACAEDKGVDFMATAFDFESVEFLEKLGVKSYKLASGDITNTPLLECIAKLGKPMVVSTGAAAVEELKMAYEVITGFNKKLTMLHCVAGYPADYQDLNLSFITTMKQMFPEATIGYSGHDNGILAGVVAYMLGARVVEKHFTLNRSLKGTDHKFSLEPEGMRKQVRDLRRIPVSLGDSNKRVEDFEKPARQKMGKGIYTAGKIEAGTVLRYEDLVLKSPGTEMAPYMLSEIVGKTLIRTVDEETALTSGDLK